MFQPAQDDRLPVAAADVDSGWIAGHPRFHAACRHMAAGILAMADADKRVNALFKDAGHYVAGLCAATMRADGVTLGQLRILCEQFGLLSPGRARALLLFMQYLGYIELWPGSRRPARYRLRADFVATWKTQLRVAFAATGMMDPMSAALADQLDDLALFDAVANQFMADLRARVGALDTTPAVTHVFLNRHAGSQLLRVLLLMVPPGASLAGTPLALDVVQTAARFGVSATHVRRLLADARSQGLIVMPDGGSLMFTPAGAAEVECHYANLFAQFLATSVAVSNRFALVKNVSSG